MGPNDEDSVELQVKRGDDWKSLGYARADTDSWVATFRVSNWKETEQHDYRVVYRESRTNKKRPMSTWGGTIKANPSDRPLRLGALTCQNH